MQSCEMLCSNGFFFFLPFFNWLHLRLSILVTLNVRLPSFEWLAYRYAIIDSMPPSLAGIYCGTNGHLGSSISLYMVSCGAVGCRTPMNSPMENTLRFVYVPISDLTIVLGLKDWFMKSLCV
jgi:hypothetical protein